MNLKELQANWNEFGETDPLYAILTVQGKDNNNWDEEDFFASGKKEIEELASYISSLRFQMTGSRALDFGCGVGRLTQALTGFYQEVCGVDIAHTMVARARRFNRHGDRCTYYVNDRTHLRIFPDQSFDLIYSNITLQHMTPEYSKEYIREFVRLLTDSGLLIFQLPSAIRTSAKPTITVRQLIKKLLPPRLLKSYRTFRYKGARPVMQMYAVNETEIVNLLVASGAQVVDITRSRMSEDGWSSLRYCARRLRPAATR